MLYGRRGIVVPERKIELSEHERPEFRATIGSDGTVRVPAAYLAECGLHSGAEVSVRVTERVLSDAMQDRAVTEPEVDTMCRTQLEARENVLTFLSSEGALGDTMLADRLRRKQ